MFTGLAEEVGVVRRLVRGTGAEIRVAARLALDDVRVGDSICVNGVCLTVTRISGNELSFDAVEETLSKSNLGMLRAGDEVNLERSVSANRLFGGHFVLGHIDGVGTILRFEKRPKATMIYFKAPETVMRYIVAKGSIAIDGISLTVAEYDERGLSVAVIPHTLENTAFRSKSAGDSVNMEADILGKYVEKFVAGRTERKGITMEYLADTGWLEE